METNINELAAARSQAQRILNDYEKWLPAVDLLDKAMAAHRDLIVLQAQQAQVEKERDTARAELASLVVQKSEEQRLREEALEKMVQEAAAKQAAKEAEWSNAKQAALEELAKLRSDHADLMYRYQQDKEKLGEVLSALVKEKTELENDLAALRRKFA